MSHAPGSPPGPDDEHRDHHSDSRWSAPPSPGQSAGEGPYTGSDQPAGPEQPAGPTSIGLDPPIAGLLAYAFGWISGLIILLLEKQHQPTRFHAAQSIVVFGALSVVGLATSAVAFMPVIGWVVSLIWFVLGPVALILWVVLMVQAYQQAEIRLPLAADAADQILRVVR